jgi:hypothetical protein
MMFTVVGLGLWVLYAMLGWTLLGNLEDTWEGSWRALVCITIISVCIDIFCLFNL